MSWNRPAVLAIALTASLTPAATSHAAPPAPPLSFADAIEQLAAVDKEASDVANGAAVAATRTRPHPRHRGVHTVGERERPDRAGRNDTLERAQRIRRFGTGSRDAHDVRLAGTLVELNAPPTPIGHVEDDGAIPLASPTGLTAERSSVRASAVIGDGPHGTIEGDGSGDFDFYRIDDAAAGQLLTVDIDAAAVAPSSTPSSPCWRRPVRSSPSTTTPRSSTASCSSCCPPTATTSSRWPPSARCRRTPSTRAVAPAPGRKVPTT